MKVYKEGDCVDIHLARELIESNIKSFHVPCGFWDGYLEERADGWYILACEVDCNPYEIQPVAIVKIDPDEIRDIRICVKSVRDEPTHRHAPGVNHCPQWPTEYSYSQSKRADDVKEWVLNFRTTNERLFNVIQDLLDAAIKDERRRGRR